MLSNETNPGIFLCFKELSFLCKFKDFDYFTKWQFWPAGGSQSVGRSFHLWVTCVTVHLDPHRIMLQIYLSPESHLLRTYVLTELRKNKVIFFCYFWKRKSIFSRTTGPIELKFLPEQDLKKCRRMRPIPKFSTN